MKMILNTVLSNEQWINIGKHLVRDLFGLQLFTFIFTSFAGNRSVLGIAISNWLNRSEVNIERKSTKSLGAIGCKSKIKIGLKFIWSGDRHENNVNSKPSITPVTIREWVYGVKDSSTIYEAYVKNIFMIAGIPKPYWALLIP